MKGTILSLAGVLAALVATAVLWQQITIYKTGAGRVNVCVTDGFKPLTVHRIDKGKGDRYCAHHVARRAYIA